MKWIQMPQPETDAGSCETVMKLSDPITEGHFFTGWAINTLWTGDADLRLYITTVQDGWRKSAFLTRAWFPRTTHLITQYMEHFSEWSRWRMFIRGLEL